MTTKNKNSTITARIVRFFISSLVGEHQSELEKISRALKQVDLYNEELRSKILVAKRTTLKAEKEILRQEIEKKRQDFFIDHLTEQLRSLQEKRAVFDNQLHAQQLETQAARVTIHDTSSEIEASQLILLRPFNLKRGSL